MQRSPTLDIVRDSGADLDLLLELAHGGRALDVDGTHDAHCLLPPGGGEHGLQLLVVRTGQSDLRLGLEGTPRDEEFGAMVREETALFRDQSGGAVGAVVRDELTMLVSRCGCGERRREMEGRDRVREGNYKGGWVKEGGWGRMRWAFYQYDVMLYSTGVHQGLGLPANRNRLCFQILLSVHSRCTN